MKETEPTHDVVRLPPALGGPIDASAIEDAVREWVTHPAFAALAATFDGPRMQDDLACYLEALERFSAVWDFRGGKERNLARPAEVSGLREAQILDAARILGLREAFERPHADRYDHCLILGGMVRACVIRPAWAAELARSGVRFGDVTALGGFRRLGGDEPALARAAGMSDVADELHAMDAGLQLAFGVSGSPVVDGQYDPADPNSSWAVHRFRMNELPLSVVAAPSEQPQTRRANTADSYAWWAKNVAKLTAGHRVLLVTSSIYVPFQHADAVRMLAAVYGCAVETVGVPAEWTVSGMPLQQFTAANYLQEIRSAIRSLRMLVNCVRQV
jgi:hypothetical protein